MKACALITGATSGFGEATARRFHQEGWKVILTGRRQERLESLCQELGEGAWPLVLDVTKREEVEKTIQSLPPDFSQIDLLMNNAGLALGLEPAHQARLEDWEQMVDTNIKGLLYVTRAVLPGMVERGSGLVVNVGSVAGSYPYPGANCYGSTKAFVKQFSLNLRADLTGTGVRVTNLEPGAAETEFSLVRFKGNQEQAHQVYQGLQPLVATDMANLVWLVANLPPHVNVNRLEVMCTAQAFAGFSMTRKG